MFEDCRKVKSYDTTADGFSRLLDEMEIESEKRIKLFRSVKNKVYIEKLETWNEVYPDKALPFKFVIIDEFSSLAEKDNADIMEKFRQRVQKDRKAGIHYMAAMQRPDSTIIQGSIKGNMSTRIAFKAVSQIDSEVILGGLHGAEKIKNQGRFLAKHRGELKEYQAYYIEPKSIRKLLKDHGCYKTRDEIEAEKQLARKKQIEDFHKRFKNPYMNGGDPA
jgi:DNA segregation ATPase FtsK/SpoIIIE-like protein